MDPLQATIEEFAADGYTHVECYCPRCRAIRLRPISYLPGISMGLTIAHLCTPGPKASAGPVAQPVSEHPQNDRLDTTEIDTFIVRRSP
jgi:hypothetical protein